MTTQDPRDRDEHNPEDVDRLFREIVASFDQDRASAATEGAADGPEDVGTPPRPADTPSPDDSPPSAEPRPISHLGPGTPSGMATDHRSYEPPYDPEEDHFIPPPTPPLPAGDLHFWGILIGLVGGPLLLFVSAVIPILGPPWGFIGAVMLAVGFVLLVLRLPQHRRDDDWGAQV